MVAETDRPSFQGGMSFEDFLGTVRVKLGNRETKEGIDRIFDLFDDDRTGRINLKNLKRVSKGLGNVLNDEELLEILKRSGTNGEELSREDFFNIMTRQTFG